MNIENLVLSGGAIKGIVYAGCFQALEEYGIINFNFFILEQFSCDNINDLNERIKYWENKIKNNDEEFISIYFVLTTFSKAQ